MKKTTACKFIAIAPPLVVQQTDWRSIPRSCNFKKWVLFLSMFVIMIRFINSQMVISEDGIVPKMKKKLNKEMYDISGTTLPRIQTKVK